LKRTLVAGFLLSVACCAFSAGITHAATRKTLYSFSDGMDGAIPAATMVLDAAGNLYGTTLEGGTPQGLGTVFKLTRPGPGHTAWTETVLYRFKTPADGFAPEAPLIFDRAGNLYGTTRDIYKDYYGTVFKLSPPAPGQTAWTHTVLYRFKGGSDSGAPLSRLAFDRAGNLYGTTSGADFGPPPLGYGTVFKLAPPVSGKGLWTETILHSFGTIPFDGNYPEGGVVLDAGGNLYGTAKNGGGHPGCGVVFRLAPPAAGKTAWTESILYNPSILPGCSPIGELSFDKLGNLYGVMGTGTLTGIGAIFKLAPPTAGRTAWRPTPLFTQFKFANGNQPLAGVVFDPSGNLYGVTGAGGTNGIESYGTVYELTPPKTGKGPWKETVLWTFTGEDGVQPTGGLVRGTAGHLFGTTVHGGTKDRGTVFEIVP